MWTVIIGITDVYDYRYSWNFWIVHVLYVDVRASLNLSSPSVKQPHFVSTSKFLYKIWFLFPSHFDVRARWKRWNLTQHHGKKAIKHGGWLPWLPWFPTKKGLAPSSPKFLGTDGTDFVPLARILGYFGLATSPTKAFSQFCRRSN